MTIAQAHPGLMLVEDTPSLQMLYRAVLNKAGFKPFCASTGEEAVRLFSARKPSVVLLDLGLPDRDGLSLLTEMLQAAPETRVIVITANGSVDKAVEATRKGAHDFLVKPLGDVRLVSTVANAMTEYRTMSDKQGRDPAHAQLCQSTFIARSAPMREVQSIIAALARSSAPVFIRGASGTGKKACASIIHLRSARASRPFVAVDCALPDPHALEAALFGTGTSDGEAGASALHRVQGGTLFLRAPEMLPAELQTRLLCVLDAGVDPDQRSTRAPLDFRVICASRNDPQQAMQAQQLRDDLYYRLYVLPLTLPPLDARGEDLPLLAEHFLQDIATQEAKSFSRIAPDAKARLQRHDWKGNLHELRNILRQAVVLHDGPELTAAMLSALPDAPAASPHTPPAPPDLDHALSGKTLAEIEAFAIRAAIARHGGSIPRAAQELDIAPSTIYRRRNDWSDQDA